MFHYEFLRRYYIKAEFAFDFSGGGSSKDYAAAAICLLLSRYGAVKHGVEMRTWSQMPK